MGRSKHIAPLSRSPLGKTPPYFSLLQEVHGDWSRAFFRGPLRSFHVSDWPKDIPQTAGQILFADDDPRDPYRLRSIICNNFFEIPSRLYAAHLWSEQNTWGCFDAASEWTDGPTGAELVRHTSFFMAGVDLSLIVRNPEADADPIQAAWHFPRIISSWKVGCPIQIAIVNLPTILKTRLHLSDDPEPDVVLDPYSAHALFYNPISDVHFKKTAAITERVNDLLHREDLTSDPDFAYLYVQVRNCQDFLETIDVDISSLERLTEAHAKAFDSSRHADRLDKDQQVHGHRTQEARIPPDAFLRTHEHLNSHVTTLNGFARRLHALTQRLESRIALGFNQVSQRDSQATVQLSRVATRDSAAMKVIAFTTVLLLPATFVAAIFGTNFFVPPQGLQWNDSSPNTTLVSSNFWVYWAVSVPITLVCGCAGLLWHHSEIIPALQHRMIDAFRKRKTNTHLVSKMEKTRSSEKNIHQAAQWKTGKVLRTYEDFLVEDVYV